MECFMGMIIGLALGFYAAALYFDPQSTLNACAREHNVYQCEMVAVPKIGEKQ